MRPERLHETVQAFQEPVALEKLVGDGSTEFGELLPDLQAVPPDANVHLTEMAQVLPTAAMQALAGEVFGTRDAASIDTGTDKPLQLDRCHALRTDGPAVAQYYPRWYVGEAGPTLAKAR